VHWNSRGHFFAAAAEAMRRILIEQARAKRGPKRGGERQRVDLEQALAVADERNDELLSLNDALERFEMVDPVAAQVVKLRYFAGLSMPETAAALQMPLRTAERHWTYARTWLHRALS
jgi:RNA polymerase sigma factor (TIGR02999 family)